VNNESEALVRLALSRERLRQALSEPSQPQQHAGRSDATHADAPVQSPVAQLIVDTVRAVWAPRPLAHAIDAAAQVGRAALRPVAQNHPWGLVSGAALAGGLLVASRPWRWPFKPAFVAAWLPQLLMWTLAKVPTQSGAPASTSRPAAVLPRTQ
jgi:hypothetical protein